MLIAQLQAPPPLQLPPGPSLERVRGPVEIPPYEPWQIGLIIFGAGVLLSLFLWGLFRLRGRKKDRKISLDPHKVALIALSESQIAALQTDEALTLHISRVLRRYFEEALNIPSKGKTTEEFLHQLKDNSLLASSERELLSRCLQKCDQVKFARGALSKITRDSLVEDTHTLITQIHTAKETETAKEVTKP